METLEPPDASLVIFDNDPDRLVKRVIEALDDKYTDIRDELTRHDQEWSFYPGPQKPHAGSPEFSLPIDDS